MNKIFKIVWNAARGKMMVVNEATSSVQTGKKATVTVAAVGMLLAGSAFAATINETETDYSVVSGEATLIHSDGTVHSNDIFYSHGVHFVTLPENKNLEVLAQNYLSIGEDNGDGTYGAVTLETTGDLTLGGARITNFETDDVLSGKNVTLTSSINQLGESQSGGQIIATDTLSLNWAKFVDTKIQAKKIVVASSGGVYGKTSMVATEEMDFAMSIDVRGEAIVKAPKISLASTMTLQDDIQLDVEKIVFKNASGRIENWTEDAVSFNELEVNGSGEAKLVNKSLAEGYAFEIGSVVINDGAQLAIYTDNQRYTDDPEVEANALGAKLGDVSLGEGAELYLGWRSSSYEDSSESVIDTLKLGEGAKVLVKDGASDSSVDNADVSIKSIEIAGNGAEIGGNLVGEETTITVNEGVEGASIAKISSKKARITVEQNAEDQLTIEEVATDSKVEVTTEQDINTGNAEADLDKLASAVNVNDGEVTLAIAENDVYGALSGTLDKTGLSGAVQAVNTKTQAVADQVTLAPQMITRIMMNDVRKRMGDLRAAEGTHGVWARYNGGQMAGSGMEADFNMIQVGIDTVPVADAPRFGVAFSYAQTEADATNGLATTDMDAFSLAFYGTKMYDNGMFVDVIGRMATVDADMKVSGNKGKMDNVALSLSGELGWRFDVTDRFFIEPSAELTYTYTNADTFTMGTGKYELEATDSLVGRASFAAGFKCPANKGDVYVRAAVVHEFMGDVTMNSWGANGNAATPVEMDGEDTYFEYAVGAQFNINKNTYVYADVERTEGANVDEDWRANVGVRFAF